MAACYEAVHGLLKPGGCFLDYDIFDNFGGVPLHQHSMKVAGFKAADPVWHTASDRRDQGGGVRRRCRSAAATGSTSGTR